MTANPQPLQFGDLGPGDYFVFMDHLWEKIGETTAIADGYEASNYFSTTQEVKRPENKPHHDS